MKIDTQALTTCEVAADGGAFRSVRRLHRKPATIRLSLNQVGALAMTLPGLIDKALQTRYGDQSLRYAYPLASWAVEQSTDPTQGMVTLRTVDVYRLLLDPAQQQSELGEALVAQPAPKGDAGELAKVVVDPHFGHRHSGARASVNPESQFRAWSSGPSRNTENPEVPSLLSPYDPAMGVCAAECG